MAIRAPDGANKNLVWAKIEQGLLNVVYIGIGRFQAHQLFFNGAS